MIINMVSGYDWLSCLTQGEGALSSRRATPVSLALIQPSLVIYLPAAGTPSQLTFYPSLLSTVRVLRTKMTPRLCVVWVLLRLL